MLYQVLFILILKKEINIKRSTISNLTKNQNGILSYEAENYDIFSKLYVDDVTWNDFEFDLNSIFISNIQSDISYNISENDKGYY